MRILELFGGYGSQALALENLGIPFKSDLCEIDKYAIQAYNQLHGETFNYGDICSIDETQLPYYDLITYSSPCQDFSVAGKQAGGEKGSGTRSSLLWECERIIRAVKPKYLLMENVKALTSKKFMPLFQNWLRTLEEIGYQNWWKVLNAKDYGVPQNRERVFVVSILGEGDYEFPKPIPLDTCLKDILEPVVDEKYYLAPRSLSYIEQKKEKDYKFRVEISSPDNIRETPLRTLGDRACVAEPYNTEEDGTSRTIKAQYAKTSSANFERTGTFGATGVLEPMALDEQNRYIRKDGCVGTLTTDGSSPKHNNRVIEPKVMQEPMNLYPNSGNPQAGRVYNANGISPAMDTCQGGNRMPKITEQYRIRKLTPRECWRLMGVRDDQFDKLSGISNSQLYKLAGNSIVVDVLMAIFYNLFIERKNKDDTVTS